MIEIPFLFNNQEGRVLKLIALQDLECDILTISENQDYEIPSNPLDNGTFIADTIWKPFKSIDVEVLVENSNINSFKSTLESVQFSNTMFTVQNLANEIFNNLKLTNYYKMTDNDSVSHTRFNLSFAQILLVEALVETYEDVAKPATAPKQQVGTKNTTPIENEGRKRSTAKGGKDWAKNKLDGWKK